MIDQSQMVTETALVLDVEDDFAWVECISRSACGHCHAADSCGNSTIAKAFAPRSHRFQVKLKHPVLPGQRIDIGLPAQSLVRSALLVYIMPLILMIAGVLVAVGLFGNTDNIALIGCAVGALMGFFGARWWAKRLNNNRAYQPVMLSVHS